jgi:hypothetical protein
VKVSYLHMTKFSQIGPIPFLWHNLSDWDWVNILLTLSWQPPPKKTGNEFKYILLFKFGDLTKVVTNLKRSM